MFTFTVKPPEGDEFTVVADSRDVYIFEQTSHGRILADLQRPAMGDFLALAHIAARRQGVYDGTLQDFCRTCVLDIADEHDAGEPDPTSPAPSAGP